MISKKFVFGILIFTLILTFANVSALGITPGRTTINFESGLKQKVDFTVLNSEHKNMAVVFTVRGDLADYITLETDYVEFTSKENSKTFSYSVNLPSDLKEPGLYETDIIALEAPADFKEKGTFVGATVSVITQLHVQVPYPDRYVDANINVISSDASKTIFAIPMVNRGEKDISNLKIELNIYDNTEEKIKTIKSDKIELKSLERQEVFLEWDDAIAGTYKAIATIRYSGDEKEIEIEFNVGDLALEVTEILINDFVLGGIAKFDALVENRWDQDLENVYLDILVYDSKKDIMADFKSQTYNMVSLGNQRMVAYWDTAGVDKGNYDADLVLKYGKYGEKSISRNVEMEVADDYINIIGLTGKVIVNRGESSSLNKLLVVAVIFLLIGNVTWFIVARSRKKKK